MDGDVDEEEATGTYVVIDVEHGALHVVRSHLLVEEGLVLEAQALLGDPLLALVQPLRLRGRLRQEQGREATAGDG